MMDATIAERAQDGLARALKLETAARGVEELRAALRDSERGFAAELEAIEPSMRRSALNLVHYLAVRRHDVRELQVELERLGLSSLGRMEAHVDASLQAVLQALHALRGEPIPPGDAPAVSFNAGDRLLSEHAAAILGPAPTGRDTRIMVTMPGHAAEAPGLIRELLEAGMDIMRINCAHDSPPVWLRMVQHLRGAERETRRHCRVCFDLAGPKLRTGPLSPGPAVVKWRPKRDAIGRVISPARIRLVNRAPDTEAEEAHIPVAGEFIVQARQGDAIVFSDARKRKRSLDVVATSDGACLCETSLTAYVVPGTRLTLQRNGRAVTNTEVGDLPAVEQWIGLRPGDTLEVVHGDEPGRDAIHDEDGRLVQPAFVSCPVRDLFMSVRAGEPILFDDGRIRGTIREALPDKLRVGIDMVHGGSAKLRAGKGINVPESELSVPAMTPKDLEDLALVAKCADMVSLSFARSPADVDCLLTELAKLDASRLGIVLKIETQAAFSRLPMLLLTALKRPPVAVMVARGDLGVEVGFERLSEVQEEILWLCEAAHVPLIWATQVLESLAKAGMPSRAEVTDAAMGSRAECVMLNKGPYIRETLRFLVDVLHRMKEHQHKKSALPEKAARIGYRAGTRAPTLPAQRGKVKRIQTPRRPDMATTLEAPADPVAKLSPMLVGGEWVHSADGRTIEVRNPANHELVAQVPHGTAKDVDLAVRKAAAAFEEWKRVAPRERGKILMKIADAVEAQSEAIARMIATETGNAIRTQSRPEAKSAAEFLRYFGGVASELKGETVPLGANLLSYTTREPLGVVGAIIPWNSPVILAAMKIAMSIAAGNTLVLKAAEDAPLAVLMLAKACAPHLPAGVLNVLTGYGETCGAPLAKHPLVRKLSFTGSTEVGKIVMHAAADRIVPVSLELGGKSPAIVFPDSDDEATVDGVITGMRFTRQGQSCTAGSRLFLHRSIFDSFLGKLRAKLEALKIGDPLDEATDMGAIINEKQFKRVCSYIAEGMEQQGVRVVMGGLPPKSGPLSRGFFVEPTVFANASNEWRIAREEIFGPVLVAIPWDDEREAVRMANDSHYGLAAYVWCHDVGRALRTAHQLDCGWIQVNQGGGQVPGHSYGGWKQSGIGREFSLEGMIDGFTQRKSVTVNLRA